VSSDKKWNYKTRKIGFRPSSLQSSSILLTLLYVPASCHTYSRHIPHHHQLPFPPHTYLVSLQDKDHPMTKIQTRTVLGKRLRHRPQKPVFPYCLRCNASDPDHSQNLCPLSKTCQWCMSTQHSHNKCPAPHLMCELRRCVVTYNHPNYRHGCPALPSSVLAYEMQLAAWDYDRELYKNAT